MTRLEVLQAANADAGLVAAVEVTPAGVDCPVHEVPLDLHRLRTLSGWQGITVCPQFDRSCRHDPNSHPTAAAPPADDTSETSAPPADPVSGF